jgi:hypothetical protein
VTAGAQCLERLPALRKDLERYERELVENPRLAELILSRPDLFPTPPRQPEPVEIRTDASSLDMTIGRALALSVEGVKVILRLEGAVENLTG